MSTDVITFELTLIIEPDGDSFYAYCPDLEGLHVAAETESEACKAGLEAARVYLESLVKHGDPIPLRVAKRITRYSLAETCVNAWRGLFPPKQHIYTKTITVQ